MVRRFIAASTALLLMALAAQVALAEYEPVGTLELSSGQPAAGGTLVVAGGGFAPSSEVRITIESTPVLLATVTTNAEGAFSTTVTIPEGYSGTHQIVATGVDPDGSVRVLASTVVIVSAAPPATDVGAGSSIPTSDALILAIAGLGIALVTGGLLLATRRISAR